MEPDTGIIPSLVGHGSHDESSFHSLFLLLRARGRTKEIGASFLPHLMGGIAVRKHQNWRLRTKRELRISLENIARRQPHHERRTWSVADHRGSRGCFCPIPSYCAADARFTGWFKPAWRLPPETPDFSNAEGGTPRGSSGERQAGVHDNMPRRYNDAIYKDSVGALLQQISATVAGNGRRCVEKG